MRQNKYIIFDNGLLDYIVVFPDGIQHADMDCDGQAISAGFIRLNQDTGLWECYGESVSLELEARPVDNIIANNQLPKMNFVS